MAPDVPRGVLAHGVGDALEHGKFRLTAHLAQLIRRPVPAHVVLAIDCRVDQAQKRRQGRVVLRLAAGAWGYAEDLNKELIQAGEFLSPDGFEGDRQDLVRQRPVAGLRRPRAEHHDDTVTLLERGSAGETSLLLGFARSHGRQGPTSLPTGSIYR